MGSMLKKSKLFNWTDTEHVFPYWQIYPSFIEYYTMSNIFPDICSDSQ